MTRTRIPKPASREEWLELRKPFFNASATSVLFDRHPFMSPGDYATTKLSGFEQAETKAMRRGTMLEDAIGQWWALEHGHTIAPVDELYVADGIMATPDRWDLDDDCPIEIKTTGETAYEARGYWLDQCQSIMHCAGADMCWLVWLDNRMELHEAGLCADLELQTEIVKRAERFMAAIELGIVPDWVELSYENVAHIYPQSAGVAELDDDGLELVRQLETLRDIKREAEKEERATKDAIAKLLLEHEAGTWNGLEVVTWRTARPQFKLDVEMLTADHPDLVEKYSREIPGSRRMLTKLNVGGQ